MDGSWQLPARPEIIGSCTSPVIQNSLDINNKVSETAAVSFRCFRSLRKLWEDVMTEMIGSAFDFWRTILKLATRAKSFLKVSAGSRNAERQNPIAVHSLASVNGFRVSGRALVLCAVFVFLATFGVLADKIYIDPNYPIREQGNLSPPHIEGANECSTHVYVDSFVPHATIKVYLNTMAPPKLIGGPIAPHFGFAAIPLTQPLKVGDNVTATQTVNGVTSGPSVPMIVGAMPAHLPQPNIPPKIYACGRVVPVYGLVPGVTVEVRDKTTGMTIGTGSTPNDWGSDWVPVLTTSPLKVNHQIEARQLSCKGAHSIYSQAIPVSNDPPMTPPTLDQPIQGNDAITAHGLFMGALFQAFNHAAPFTSGYATADSNWFASPVIPASASITAKQSLCTPSKSTKPQGATSTISAPMLLGPICPGQVAAYVRDTTINATLVLSKNNQVVGYGGAAPGDVPLDIAPPAVFTDGDVVQVVEYIGSIVVLSNKVIVGCTHVTTYHNDSQRTGWNPDENTLTPSNVVPGSFGWITTVPLDDQVDTQPLVVTNQLIKGQGTHTVVYVTTENNSVYAIDSWTGDILLKRLQIAAPVPSPLSCNNNGPNVGINGTATIDLGAHALYVIVYTTVGGSPAHQLHALDLSTLDELPGSPVTVSATHAPEGGGADLQFNSTNQRQRPALLEANGNIYAGFGSYCDFAANDSRGWLLGWNSSTLAPLSATELTNQIGKLSPPASTIDCTYAGNHPCFLSSIWMSGYGLAADTEGNIYFTTGNTAGNSTTQTYDSTYNIGESVAKISGALSPMDFFTPSNESSLDSGDTDYGSGGVMVLPDQSGQFPHLAVASGKDGRMFVLNRDSMGGFHSPDIPQNVNIDGCWCGPSYFNTGGSGGARVVSSGGLWNNSQQLSYDKVQLWSLTTAGSPPLPTLSLVASSSLLELSGNDPGFFTSVSSQETTANTAIIWAVDRANGTDNHVTLYAFNATPSGSSLPLLWSSPKPAGYWPNTGGNPDLVPTVANGRVYVASNKQLQIFGLIPSTSHGPKRRTGAAINNMLREQAAASPAPAGPQFWGTVKSINGDHLELELRTGRILQVDISAAVQQKAVGDVQVGQPALVEGALEPDGTFKAGAVMRAKGQSLWGEDREK